MKIKKRILNFLTVTPILWLAFHAGNVEASSAPRLSISTNSPALLSDTVNIDLAMDNSGADTGFYPMIELTLPRGLSCNAACASSIATTNPPGLTAPFLSVSVCGPVASGGPTSCTNSVTGEVFSRGSTVQDGQTKIFITLPVGSLAAGQPAVTLRVPTTFSTLAQLGVSENITGRGIFVLGDLPNGTRGTCTAAGVDTRCQANVTAPIVPSVMTLRMEHQLLSGVGTCTGANYPRRWTITGDVATSRTITSATIQHTIPDTIIVDNPPSADCSSLGGFTVTPAFTTCAYESDPNGGGRITLGFASVVGGATTSDIRVTFDGYIQEFEDNNLSRPILSQATGAELIASVMNVTGNYSFNSVAQTPLNASVTTPQNAMTSSKSVSVFADNAPAGVIQPGDILQWTVSTCISDYFDFEDVGAPSSPGHLSIVDHLADGQTLDFSTFEATVREDSDVTATIAGSPIENYINSGSIPVKDGAGVTLINFDLMSALTDPAVFSLPDLILNGGTSGGTSFDITYKSLIDEEYVSAQVGTRTLSANDPIRNQADVSLEIAGTSQSLVRSVSAARQITPITVITKTQVAKNTTFPGDNLVGAGDVVTYKLRIVVPEGDAENIVLRDYLPTPLFDAQDMDADGLNETIIQAAGPCTSSPTAVTDVLPAAGEWCFSTASTLTPATTVSQNGSTNQIQWNFGDNENSSSSNQGIIEILFSVAGTNDPMADGLQLVNILFLDYANSGDTAFNAAAVATQRLETEEPKLVVTKSANAVITGGASISSGNFINVDAGDVLEFKVLLQNTGSETAFLQTDHLGNPVYIQDDLPSDLVAPTGGHQITLTTAAGSVGQCQCENVGVPGDFSACAASVYLPNTSATVVGDIIRLTGIRIQADATCDLRYRVQVPTTTFFGTTITNTATARYNSIPGALTFSPESDTATATTKNPSIAKAIHPASSSFSYTTDPNLAIGEVVSFDLDVTLPEGTYNAFFIKELDSVTGPSPATNFFKNFSSSDVSYFVAGSPVNLTTDLVACSNPATPTYFSFSTLPQVCFQNDLRLATNYQQTSTTNFQISFGQLINYDVVDATAETFQVRIRSQISDTLNLPAGTYRNRAQIQANNSGTRTFTANRDFTLVLPNLVLDKTSTTVAPVSIGDLIQYQVALTNTGNAPAFDVSNIVDTFPTNPDTLSSALVSANTVSAQYLGGSISCKSNYALNQTGNLLSISVVDDSPALCPDATAGNPDIGSGEDYTVRYSARVAGTMVADTTSGPGHPGGIIDGPGPVDSIVNSADVARYFTGDGSSGDQKTSIAADSVTLTLDSDRDGILNSIEGATSRRDSDGDGVPDYLDTDSDDNDISDRLEFASGRDSDGDGIPDYRDEDDDNDGVDDYIEITNNPRGLSDGNLDLIPDGAAYDADGDGRPDYLDPDSDNDGIADGAEGVGRNTDSASDGNNHIDLDSDNDGIPDLVEVGLGLCDNGANDGDNADGPPTNPTGVGTARNGRLEADELSSCSAAVCIASPCDSDGSGAVEADEFVGGTLPDFDGDGIPNLWDLDSDNDGLPDLQEAGLSRYDLNQDGRIDIASGEEALVDATPAIPGGNGNGVLDRVEVIDTDGDGQPDYLDLDSDQDGIGDLIESTQSTLDGDVDGTPNHLDLDSDNDGIPDNEEFGLTSCDANGDSQLSSSEVATCSASVCRRSPCDQDASGTIDLAELVGSDLRNTDSQGGADAYDTDADGDGLSDILEGGRYVCDQNLNGRIDYPTELDGTPAVCDDLNGNGVIDNDASELEVPNTDLDALPDYLDLDSDGDGLSDQNENDFGVDTLISGVLDTDADGIPNFQDIDSDNDGVNDRDEVALGTQVRQVDTDGDGCSDGCEVFGEVFHTNACPIDGKSYDPGSPPAGLSSPITNPLDADTDDGGTNDCDEASGTTDPTTGHGADDPFQSADPDGDGCSNVTELAAGTDINLSDTDSDGINDCDEINDSCLDALDSDTDNDGLNDGLERRLNTNPCVRDTDGDGLSDREEVDQQLTDPLDPDTDNDGLTDATEVNVTFTDPLVPEATGEPAGTPANPPQGQPAGPGDPIVPVSCVSTQDTDSNSIPDAIDLDYVGADDDADDIPDCCQSSAVSDDLLNFDRDGDSFPDCVEFRIGTDVTDGQNTVQGSSTAASRLGGSCALSSAPQSLSSHYLGMLTLLIFPLGLFFMRKKRSLLFGFLLFFISFIGSVQAFDVQWYQPQSGATSGYSLWTSDRLRAKEFSLGVSANYVRRPLEIGVRDNDPRVFGIVDSFLGSNFLASYGITDRISLEVNLPFNFYHDIAPVLIPSRDKGSLDFGDLRVQVPIQIYDASKTERHWGLVVVPMFVAPTGDKDLFFGEKTVSGGLVLGVDKLWDDKRLYFNLGTRFREKDRLFNLVLDQEFLYGIGYTMPLRRSIDLGFTTEVVGSTEYRKFFTEEITSPAEARFTLHKKLLSSKRLTVHVGGALGLTNGYGSPDWRFFGGLAYRWSLKKEEVSREICSGVEVRNIRFNVNSAQILPESYSDLDRILHQLKTCKVKHMKIIGHTDSDGSVGYNKKLSLRRAESVRLHLVKLGAAASMEVDGAGESSPMSTNATSEGKAQNRRIEFILSNSSSEP